MTSINKDLGRIADGDRASRPTAQAPAGLGDTATIPCAAHDFGQHELLDRAALLCGSFDDWVLGHRDLGLHPNLQRMANIASLALSELYQAFGQEFLGGRDGMETD